MKKFFWLAVAVCIGASAAGAEENLIVLLNKQLTPCSKIPEGGGGADLPMVHVKFALKSDGHLDGPVTVINPQDNALFKIAAEASVAAVKNCAPYRLPEDRYKVWKTVTWQFDWPVIVGKKVGRIYSEECSSSGADDIATSKDEFVERVRAEGEYRARFVTSPRKAKVTVRLKLSSGGGVKERSVAASSGNAEIDELALSLTHESFIGFSIGMNGGEPLEVDVPFSFKEGTIATNEELEKKEVADGRRAVQRAAMSAYLGRIRKLITREKTVVPSWKVPVTVMWRIDKNGKGSCGKILVSAGDPLADEQAVHLVNSVKYPPFTPEMEKDSFTTYGIIDFSQRNPRKFD